MLGPSKKKFKLFGFYLILDNLPAHLRSQVEMRKLVLCRNSYMKMLGSGQIVQLLLRD